MFEGKKQGREEEKKLRKEGKKNKREKGRRCFIIYKNTSISPHCKKTLLTAGCRKDTKEKLWKDSADQHSPFTDALPF